VSTNNFKEEEEIKPLKTHYFRFYQEAMEEEEVKEEKGEKTEEKAEETVAKVTRL
jgi:hypothetical protein